MDETIKVYSEIAPLKRVLLHRPGKEIENLTPEYLDRLLFDDIPWLDGAREEHDFFAKTLMDLGVEVVYLEDLIAEALDTSEIVKSRFIKQFLKEARVYEEYLKDAVYNYLNSIESTKEMICKTMMGILKSEVEIGDVERLYNLVSDYPFITDPLPNLYFTRDPFASIFNGISINKMHSETRSRETIYAEYIFNYHPEYKDHPVKRYYDRYENFSIEGGDILVLSEKVLAIGISERTRPQAIDVIAENIFLDADNELETILAFNIPKTRSYMHLDTIFTQIDKGLFTIYGDLIKYIDIFEIKQINGEIKVTKIDCEFVESLEKYLGTEITLIPTGNGDIINAGREQWNDGSNLLAVRPGEVIAYSRNHITNKRLIEHGVKVHVIPSSELSRGRGGPRCMSMPLIRE